MEVFANSVHGGGEAAPSPLFSSSSSSIMWGAAAAEAASAAARVAAAGEGGGGGGGSMPKLMGPKELSELMGLGATQASSSRHSQSMSKSLSTRGKSIKIRAANAGNGRLEEKSGLGGIKRRRELKKRRDKNYHFEGFPRHDDSVDPSLQLLDDALSVAHSMANSLRDKVLFRLWEKIGSDAEGHTCPVEFVNEVLLEYGGMEQWQGVVDRALVGPETVDFERVVATVASEMRAMAMARMLATHEWGIAAKEDLARTTESSEPKASTHRQLTEAHLPRKSSRSLTSSQQLAPMSGSPTILNSAIGASAGEDVGSIFETNVENLRRQLQAAEAEVHGFTRAVQADISWVHQNVKGGEHAKQRRTQILCRRWGTEKMVSALNRVHARIMRQTLNCWWETTVYMANLEVSRKYIKLRATGAIFSWTGRRIKCRVMLKWQAWRTAVREWRCKLENDAAKVIQCTLKDYARRCHENLVRRQEAATILQARARGMASRQQINCMRVEMAENEAVSSIQAIARGRRDRKKVKSIQEANRKNDASIFLQKAGRGFLGRKEAERLRQERERNVAAERIQAIYRGHVAREVVGKDLEDRQRERVAATLIQSQWRIHLAIHKVKRMKEREERDLAASTIQRMARQRMRRDAEKRARIDRIKHDRECAAIAIQRIGRGKQTRTRLYVARRDKAASNIQALTRGRRDRAKVRRLRVVLKEREARRAKLEEEAQLAKLRAAEHVAKQRAKSRSSAVLRIQSLQRGRSARRLFNKKRDARRTAKRDAEGSWGAQEEAEEQLIEGQTDEPQGPLLMISKDGEEDGESNSNVALVRQAKAKRENCAAIKIQRLQRKKAQESKDAAASESTCCEVGGPLTATSPQAALLEENERKKVSSPPQSERVVVGGGESIVLAQSFDNGQFQALKKRLSILQEAQGKQQVESVNSALLMAEQMRELKSAAQEAQERLLEEHKELLLVQEKKLTSEQERRANESADELRRVKLRLEEEEKRVEQLVSMKYKAEEELRRMNEVLNKQKEDTLAEISAILSQRDSEAAAKAEAEIAARVEAELAEAMRRKEKEVEEQLRIKEREQAVIASVMDADSIRKALQAESEAHLNDLKDKLTSQYRSQWEDIQERLHKEEAAALLERERQRVETESLKASLDEEKRELSQRLMEIKREMDEIRQTKALAAAPATTSHEVETKHAANKEGGIIISHPPQGSDTNSTDPTYLIGQPHESLESLLDCRSDSSSDKSDNEGQPRDLADDNNDARRTREKSIELKSANAAAASVSEQEQKLREFEKLLVQMKEKVELLEEERRQQEAASAISRPGPPGSVPATSPSSSRGGSPSPNKSRTSKKAAATSLQTAHDGVAGKEISSSPATEQVWVEFWDESAGASYFFNTVTQEATWTPPPGVSLPPSASGQGTVSTPSDMWTELWDEASGCPYWYNATRQEAVWDPPPGVQPLNRSYSTLVAAAPSPGVGPDGATVPEFEKPEEWVCYLDEKSGEEYWFNTLTGQVKWEHALIPRKK